MRRHYSIPYAMSNAEIASELGISEQLVSRAFNSALRKLSSDPQVWRVARELVSAKHDLKRGFNPLAVSERT